MGHSAPVAAVESHWWAPPRSWLRVVVRWGQPQLPLWSRIGGHLLRCLAGGYQWGQPQLPLSSGIGGTSSVGWGWVVGWSAPVAAVESHWCAPPRDQSIRVAGSRSAPVAAVQTHACHLPGRARRSVERTGEQIPVRPRGACASTAETPPLRGTGGARRRTGTPPPRTDEMSVDLRPFGGTPPSGATLSKLDQNVATGSGINSPQVMVTTGSDVPPRSTTAPRPRPARRRRRSPGRAWSPRRRHPRPRC
jgi:hypothetical protein